MSVNRHFLGWDGPALYKAVDFLFDNFASEDAWDLSKVAIVLPSARAGRRLLELLALRVNEYQHRILQPPQIITPESLPGLLCLDTPGVCSDLEGQLALVSALQTADRNRLRSLFSSLPASDRPSEWLDFAIEIEALFEELAGQNITCEQVQGLCELRGLDTSVTRWQVLAELKLGFRKILSANGHSDRETAQRKFLEEGGLRTELTTVLLAAVDLPDSTVELLAKTEGRVIVLIHAPESAAAGFDDYGRIRSTYWENELLPIPESDLLVVERPYEQSQVVLQTIKRIRDVKPQYVTVGVADEIAGGAIERVLRMDGHPARQGRGEKLVASGPAKWLQLLADYYSERSHARLAVLVRHPAIEDWLVAKLVASGDIESGRLPDWPNLSDKYHSKCLPVTVDEKFAGEQLSIVIRTIDDLLGEDKTQRHPLAHWGVHIMMMLAEVQGVREYDPNTPRDAATARSLSALGVILRNVENLGVDNAYSFEANFSEAVSFVMSQAGTVSVPPTTDESVTDIVGWLEAHLDDAPILIVTGFNEGHLPQSVSASPFLPNTLRRELGLLDNSRRYARDAYLVRAIMESRTRVVFVSPRQATTGNQLMPSRLMFACDDEELARRTLRFYGGAIPSLLREEYLKHGLDYSMAYLPRPRSLQKPLEALSVSAFKDYLSCPYRFYLKHILGLSYVEDEAIEMGSDVFGDLAHKVLEGFGRWVMQEHGGILPTDSLVIEKLVLSKLECLSAERFGDNCLAVVTLQLNHLKRRLSDFARLQALDSFQGWKIIEVEKKVQAQIVVDGVPLQLKGRIDRIDYHEAENAYRIIDYKTGDKGTAPKASHIDKKTPHGWSDLQLPLYHRLAPELNLVGERVETGYITLPESFGAAKFEPFTWTDDELSSANALIDKVIRNIRQQVYWPPHGNVPQFDDGLTTICLDSHLERAMIIENRLGESLVWPMASQSLMPLTAASTVGEVANVE